jgi:hypothetical protein
MQPRGKWNRKGYVVGVDEGNDTILSQCGVGAGFGSPGTPPRLGTTTGTGVTTTATGAGVGSDRYGHGGQSAGSS